MNILFFGTIKQNVHMQSPFLIDDSLERVLNFLENIHRRFDVLFFLKFVYYFILLPHLLHPDVFLVMFLNTDLWQCLHLFI